MRAQLIYYDKVSINPPNLGVAGLYRFRTNDVYDPDFTGVGHQPVGFDQYMALYKEFVVTGCQYKVAFHYTGSGNHLNVGVSIRDDSTSSTDSRVLVENGITQWGIVDFQNPQLILTGYVDNPKLVGMSRDEYCGSDQFIGTAAASPLDGILLNIWGEDSATGDPAPINLAVEMRYYVEFRGHVTTALS